LFHFHTRLHNISTIFTLLHSFLIVFPPSHWYQPTDRTCFIFLSFIFEKKTFFI
jgi:hypothetical protein